MSRRRPSCSRTRVDPSLKLDRSERRSTLDVRRYGPDEPQLYVDALTYFASSPKILEEAGDELDDVVTEVLLHAAHCYYRVVAERLDHLQRGEEAVFTGCHQSATSVRARRASALRRRTDILRLEPENPRRSRRRERKMSRRRPSCSRTRVDPSLKLDRSERRSTLDVEIDAAEREEWETKAKKLIEGKDVSYPVAHLSPLISEKIDFGVLLQVRLLHQSLEEIDELFGVIHKCREGKRGMGDKGQETNRRKRRELSCRPFIATHI
jgi:hypothetical protein